jgi:hypothetical protein
MSAKGRREPGARMPPSPGVSLASGKGTTEMTSGVISSSLAQARSLLLEPAFSMLTCLLFMLVTTWPLLDPETPGGFEGIYRLVFGGWLVFCVVLALASGASRATPPEDADV